MPEIQFVHTSMTNNLGIIWFDIFDILEHLGTNSPSSLGLATFTQYLPGIHGFKMVINDTLIVHIKVCCVFEVN